MVAAVTIDSPEARVFAITDSGSPATGINSPLARAFAVINYPAVAMTFAQARTFVVMSQSAQIQVTQARTLVVARGRFERPRVRVWTFTLDGHDMLMLQTINETMCCDLSNGRWHIWGTGQTDLWRAHTGITWQRAWGGAVTYGSNIIAGDDTYGMLYVLNPEGQVDENPDTSRADEEFDRIIVGQIALRGRASQPCWGIEVYGAIGEEASASYSTVTLYTSDDNGHTYVNHGSKTVTLTDYTARLEWLSLGQMQAPGRLIKLVDNGALVRVDGLETPDDVSNAQ